MLFSTERSQLAPLSSEPRVLVVSHPVTSSVELQRLTFRRTRTIRVAACRAPGCRSMHATCSDCEALRHCHLLTRCTMPGRPFRHTRKGIR